MHLRMQQRNKKVIGGINMYTEKRTETDWTMTAKQAKVLAKELNYIADEANDHQHEYCSQILLDGGERGFKNPLIIVALPDKEKE